MNAVTQVIGAIPIYLSEIEDMGLAPNTIDRSSRDLSNFAEFIRLQKTKYKTPDELIGSIIVNYIQYVRKSVSKITGQRFTRKSIVTRVEKVRQFLRYLESKGILTKDFGAKTSYLCLDLTVVDYLAETEVAELLQAPNVDAPVGIRDRAMFETIYSCGVRWGELRALRVTDIRDDYASLAVLRNDNENASKRTQWIDTTYSRLIPIPSAARAYLIIYLEQIRPRIVEERGSSDVLFLDIHKGNPLHRASIYVQLKKAKDKTSIQKKAGTEILRDSLAVHLLHNGADVTAVMWFLGVAEVTDKKLIQKYSKEILAHHPRNEIAR